jgi:hypothetical protein
MRKSVLLVVGIVVAAVVIIGFLASKRGGPGVPSNPTASDSGSTSSENTLPTNSFAQKQKPKPKPPRALPDQPIPATNDGTVPGSASNIITNWEEKLDAILGSDTTSDPDKAKKMIEMFPHLTPEAQEEVAHHISNLTPDENYNLGQFLTNSTLAEAVLDVFTEDVLNRPNSVKLPLLLDLARDPQHPKAGEAKDILELFLEEDFGSDWTKWQAKLDQWLKDNPD